METQHCEQSSQNQMSLQQKLGQPCYSVKKLVATFRQINSEEIQVAKSKVERVLIIGNSTFSSSHINKIQQLQLSANDRPISNSRMHLGSTNKKKADNVFQVKIQKVDRNVQSNLIHHFLKFCESQQTAIIIGKILKQFRVSSTVDQIALQIHAMKGRYDLYVSLSLLKQLWVNANTPELCTVLRVLAYHFLRSESFTYIITSNKLCTASKANHYRGRRELLSFVLKLSKVTMDREDTKPTHHDSMNRRVG